MKARNLETPEEWQQAVDAAPNDDSTTLAERKQIEHHGPDRALSADPEWDRKLRHAAYAKRLPAGRARKPD